MSDLAAVVAEHLPYLQGLTEEQASRKPAPDVWSPKEILGHLIDSAANNHNKMIRAHEQDGSKIPDYDADSWVALDGWQGRPWSEILTLWQAYQSHMAHLMGRLRADRLQNRVLTIGDPTRSVGGGQPLTLAELKAHYVSHQLHHLVQLRERVGQ